MIYDLLVVGNGLAAQTLLFELNKARYAEDMNCQDFLVAQIFSEELAPACTIRSTSTVSLNGIEDGISELGDLLRCGFYSFENFYSENSLPFIEPVTQIITATDSKKLEALKRRFKALKQINNPLLRESFEGVELNSYLIDPNSMHSWFDDQLEKTSVERIKDFLLSFDLDSEGLIQSKTQKGLTLKSKRIIFCSGAFSSVFSSFFNYELGVGQQVVAGGYLYKKMNFENSFLLTIDGHNLLYRKFDQKLVLGSASHNGMFPYNNCSELKKIFDKFSEICPINLGCFDEFSMATGLRHKASRRLPICKFLDEHKKVGIINGLYKNGYSLSFHLAKIMSRDLLNP